MSVGKRIAAAVLILFLGVGAAFVFFRQPIPTSPPRQDGSPPGASSQDTLLNPSFQDSSSEDPSAVSLSPQTGVTPVPLNDDEAKTVFPQSFVQQDASPRSRESRRAASVAAAPDRPAPQVSWPTPPRLSARFPRVFQYNGSQGGPAPSDIARRGIEEPRPLTPDARGSVFEPPKGSSNAAWRRHRIRDGDTLGTLAKRYLGDAGRQQEIFAANRHTLRHPDLLPIGVVLRIPPR